MTSRGLGRRIGKRAALAAITVLIALIGGEIALRVFGSEPLPDVIGPRYLFVRDPELGIRLRPGFRGTHETHEFAVDVEINSLGLRDREPAVEDRDALRILALGDSFAYGFGVAAEETYAARMEEILGAERHVRVWNAGAPSYGTRQQLALLRRLLPECEPRVVLVSFFFGNDLQDNVAPPMTERGGVVLTPYFGAVIDESWLNTFALEHSNLLTLMLLRWKQVREGIEMPAPPTRPPADPAAVTESPTSSHVLAVPASEEVEAAWAETASLLRELRDTAVAAGARVVLVDVPLRYQIDDELWGRMCVRHGLANEGYDRRSSAKRLASIAAGLEMPFVDLAPALAAEPDPSALYYAINKHFTAAGHAAAARAIAEFLVREELLDG